MASIKIYRVSGLILLAYGIIGFFCYLIKQVSEEGIDVLSYGFSLGQLIMYAINPFFWAGWILFHKAMKRDQMIKKPAWLRWLLTSYIICGFFIVALALVACIGTLGSM